MTVSVSAPHLQQIGAPWLTGSPLSEHSSGRVSRIRRAIPGLQGELGSMPRAGCSATWAMDGMIWCDGVPLGAPREERERPTTPSPHRKRQEIARDHGRNK